MNTQFNISEIRFKIGSLSRERFVNYLLLLIFFTSLHIAISNAQETLVIKNRWLDSCHFFDYNDGPNDKPGPAKPEWNKYLGQYRIFYFGKPMGSFAILIKNRYLYFDDQKCLEFEPGLFFVYDGAALDFRTETVTGSNVKLLRE